MKPRFWLIFVVPTFLIQLCIGNTYAAEVNSAQFWFANSEKWQIYVKEIGTVTIYPEKNLIRVDFPQLILRSQSDAFEACSLELGVIKKTPDGWRSTDVSTTRPFSKNLSRGENYVFPEPLQLVLNVPPGFDISEAALTLDIKFMYDGTCSGYIPVHTAPLSMALTLKRFPLSFPTATNQAIDTRRKINTEPDLSPERRAAKEFIESALLSCDKVKAAKIEGPILSTKHYSLETGNTYNYSINLSSTKTKIYNNYVGLELIGIFCENPGCAKWGNDSVNNELVFFCDRFNARMKKAIDVYKAGLSTQQSEF